MNRPFAGTLHWFCVQRNVTAPFTKYTLKNSSIRQWRCCNFWGDLLKCITVHICSVLISFNVKQTKSKAFGDNLQILFVFLLLSIINVLGLALLLLLEMHYESLLWGRFRQYFYYQQNIQHDKTNEIMIHILLMPLVNWQIKFQKFLPLTQSKNQQCLILKETHFLKSLVWKHTCLFPELIGFIWNCAMVWFKGLVIFSSVILPGMTPLSKCPNKTELLESYKKQQVLKTSIFDCQKNPLILQ